MQFWKMNGAGNDFIILNNMVEGLPAESFPALARRLCDRRMSIGADGLMIVEKPTTDADYRMLFFNSDGSVGEMCGNGARCICRYGCDNGLAGEVQRVQTTAGLVTGWRMTRRQYRVQLNSPTVLRLDYPVEVDGVTYPCSYIELGSPGLPHAVVPISGLRRFPEQELFELGRKLCHHPAFPKGVNVNFYEVEGPGQIWERTYERGVEDFTHACGTGTGSVVTVLTLQGKSDGRDVHVQMIGGELVIDVEVRDGAVERLLLTGPTNVVAKGEVTDEELAL
mgnify:FL=1